MPRALTVQRVLVTPPERERFQERVHRKREHYRAANCRYWLFEEAALQGAFLEFFEGPDAETLVKAHESAPDRVLDIHRIYAEVEFT